jgi:hypothetical protein
VPIANIIGLTALKMIWQKIATRSNQKLVLAGEANHFEPIGYVCRIVILEYHYIQYSAWVVLFLNAFEVSSISTWLGAPSSQVSQLWRSAPFDANIFLSPHYDLT